MTFTIEESDWLPDWYVLTPGLGYTCVEGSFEEWVSIAEALKADDAKKLGCAGGRRCACRGINDRLYFYSPRNSAGELDGILMTLEEAMELADSIIAQYGHGAGI